MYLVSTLELFSLRISCSVVLAAQWCPTLRLHGLQPIGFLCPQNPLGKNIRVGRHPLLQAMVLTQGSNPDLQHCRQILYHLSQREAHFKGQLPDNFYKHQSALFGNIFLWIVFISLAQLSSFVSSGTKLHLGS